MTEQDEIQVYKPTSGVRRIIQTIAGCNKIRDLNEYSKQMYDKVNTFFFF